MLWKKSRTGIVAPFVDVDLELLVAGLKSEAVDRGQALGIDRKYSSRQNVLRWSYGLPVRTTRARQQ